MRFAWKRLLLAALLLLFIAGAASYGLFLFAEKRFREVTGETLVWVTTTTNTRLRIPHPWRQAVADQVASFSRAVTAGEAPLLPALRLMRSFERGPLYLALLLRGFEGQCRTPDLSRRIGRFFAAWKARGQPEDFVASLSRLLTVEVEEFSQTPSGFAVSEFVFALRTDWDDRSLATVAAFFDDFGRGSTVSGGRCDENLIGTVADPSEAKLSGRSHQREQIASSASPSRNDDMNSVAMPDPVTELRAEVARLAALPLLRQEDATPDREPDRTSGKSH